MSLERFAVSAPQVGKYSFRLETCSVIHFSLELNGLKIICSGSCDLLNTNEIA